MSLLSYVDNNAMAGAIVGLSVLIPFLVLYNQTRQRTDLPPGPPPDFFTGNSRQIPSSEPWKAYADWSHTYASPLIYLRVSNTPTIVVNTAKAAIDLLELRSNRYSDRPSSLASHRPTSLADGASLLSVLGRPFTRLFSSWSPHAILGDRQTVFATSIQDPRFRKYRRLLQTSLNPRAIKNYTDIMEQERLVLLRGFLQQPTDFFNHVRRNAGAVILKVAYGWQVTSNDDYFVKLMEEAFTILNAVHKPGGWLVDYLPILRFLPAWFPGNSYKRRAAFLKDRMWHVDNVPHRWAKEQIESGNFVDSFSSQHLQPEDGRLVDSEEEDIIKWAGGALYFGGADTTVSAVLSFILLMVLYPDAQKRAQDEIDRVVGKDRLPTLEDQEDLDYVNALIKEVLRFSTVAPLGLPHRVLEDDTYMGKRIPKGTTIVANIWAIARDEEVYGHPFTFDPTRFLEASGSENGARMDPRKLVFGFGRRVCPGAHFAEMSIFLSISGILSLYNISKPTNEQGEDMTPPFEMTTGITRHPKPFQCRIVPRRSNNMALLPLSDQSGSSLTSNQLGALDNLANRSFGTPS